jgi:SecD/SecF fusion protein
VKSRNFYIVLGVVLAAGLVVVGLPLLGVAIFFSKDISAFVFGPPTLTSGTLLVYEWQPEDGSPPVDVEALRRTMTYRLDPRGRQGYEVRPLDGRRIEVRVPAQESERAKRLLAQPGRLEFRIVADKVKDQQLADFDRLIRERQAGRPIDSAAWRWVPLKKGWEWHQQGLLNAWNFVFVVHEDSHTVEVLLRTDDGQEVTGRDLAKAVRSEQDGEPVVSFMMRPEAAARFAKLTNPGNRLRHLGIILDGEVQSAPVLQATLSTAGVITGYRDRREVDDVVSVLNSGELGVRLGEPVSEMTFGSP